MRVVLMILALAAVGCSNLEVVRYDPIPPNAKALVAQAESIIATTDLRPSREVAGRLNQRYQQDTLKGLRGELRFQDGQMARRVRSLERAMARYQKNIDWPVPADIHVPKATHAPTIDGVLDDEMWRGAWAWEAIYPYNSQQPGGPRTSWKLTWDDTYLYVAFASKDADLRALVRERDDDIWRDDCVEIYLMPDPRLRTFWEIEVSPTGSIYDSIQCKYFDTWGSDHDTSQDVEGMLVGMKADGTVNDGSDVDEGYTVELAIPFDQLPGMKRAVPKVGESIHFMLLRLDVNGTDKLKPYAHVPLLGWGHNIWNMGRMILAE